MPENELLRLQSVHRFLKLDLKVELELETIVSQLSLVCSASIAMITLWGADKQYIKCSVGADVKEIPIADTFCRFTMEQDNLLIIENALEDERTSSNPYVINHPFVKFYAGVPLVTTDNYKIGTVCILDTKVMNLSFAQQQMIKAIARQTINLMEFDASLNLLKGEYISSRQSAIKMRSYFESSSSCHLLLDPNMLILSFNKAIDDVAFEHQGIHLQEGKSVIPHIHPDFRAEFVGCFSRALNGEMAILEQDLEYALGRICWYITFSPALDPKSGIIGVSFNAIDITAKVLQQESIAKSEKTLNEIGRIQLQEIKKASDELIHSMDLFLAEKNSTNSNEIGLLEQAVRELNMFMNTNN